MKIKRHRLYHDDDTPVTYVPSPNYGGDMLEHEYLVMHYTAGTRAESSIRWLTDRQAKASAHLVIARDGSVTQLVPFNKRAWHAGRSAWSHRVGLNNYSIGIELDNAGRLMRRGTSWVNWAERTIPDEEIVQAEHRNESRSSGWHTYAPEQIDSALQVARALVAHYRLIEVIGHDDIAPGRKYDPGPAFPMSSFRSSILGRDEQEDGLYETTTKLNIRTGPGASHETLEGSPLARGTKVLVSRNLGNWWNVEVLDEEGTGSDLDGWVHARYLRPA